MCNSKLQRICCVCEKTLYGRSDKVFCDITCKNKYHASVRKHVKTVRKETIKILTKNYNILAYLKGKDSERFMVKKLELQRMGFNFDVISGLETNKFGIRMNVFEFSWYYSKNQNITVFRDKSQQEISPFVYKRWELNFPLNSTT